MVSAEAEAGKYFSLLSAFFMTISGSIESFSLCNSEDIDLFVQKIPCISHELVKSTLSRSLVLMLGDGRRAADTCFFRLLKNLGWKKFHFFFVALDSMNFLWAFVHTFPVPFWALKVNSTRFPLEERVCSELLVTEILHQEFSGGSELPSSSPGLA